MSTLICWNLELLVKEMITLKIHFHVVNCQLFQNQQQYQTHQPPLTGNSYSNNTHADSIHSGITLTEVDDHFGIQNDLKTFFLQFFTRTS